MIETLAPGQLIAERYQLERMLGEGGMGQVWAATHVITRKRVALKFLKAAGRGRDTMVRRFMREARAVSAVNHPNVVAVHDMLQLADGMPVMVMDLLGGTSLAARLVKQPKLELVEVATILVPVISAVGTAHAAGIVHRDLKPDNIMLHVRSDGQFEPKVLDFGIAKLSAPAGEAAAATAHLTNTGAVLGTPYYMAPEQVFGEKDIDQRADVWALGVIAYECLAGKRPIVGDNFGQLFKAITTSQITPLEQVAPHIPAEVTDLVTRMLERDRARRCPDLREAYGVFSRYSSTKALSFGGAAESVRGSVSTGGSGERVRVVTPGSDHPNLAFEETSAADGSTPPRPDDALAQTPGALSQSRADSAPSGPRRAVVVLAGLALLSAAGIWVAGRGNRDAGPARTASASTSNDHPGASNTSVAIVSATTPASALAPSASLLPPIASQSALPIASVRPNRPPRLDGAGREGKSAGSATTRASAVVPSTPAEKPPERLPGSVVSTVPF